MLINTNITIAYKCYSCGNLEFFTNSLFDFKLTLKQYKECHCKEGKILLVQEPQNNYKISIPCIGCGKIHTFSFSKKDVLKKSMITLSCPNTNVTICILGNDHAVRKKVDLLQKELDKIITTFGYDDYFKNTQVIFNSLNAIHDIAEKGNLLCECGNDDIELSLLSDRILLRCSKCNASKVMHASSNEDLKDILSKKQILLISNIFSIK